MLATIREQLPVDILLPSLRVISRRQLYRELAHRVAHFAHIAPERLEARLIHEETRECYGVGNGVAIPHLTVTELTRPVLLCARLVHPMTMDAPDLRPVDLVFLVLSPAADGRPRHLQRLAHVSRLLRHPHFREQLRMADTTDAMQALFFDPERCVLAA